MQLDEAVLDEIKRILEELTDDALAESSIPTLRIEHEADLRYAGQSFELTVLIDTLFDREAVRKRFQIAHERTYGYPMEVDIELVNLRTTVRAERSIAETQYEAAGESYRETRPADFGGETHATGVHARRALPAGATVNVPAVLEEAESMTVIPPE